MSDLRELYQEVILSHSKRPRNFREIDSPTRHAEGFNPLCGDRISVYLTIDGNMITDVSFTGSGCAICTSSASMMTESLKGKTLDQARHTFDRFRDLVTGSSDPDHEADGLEKLTVFSGVREFPIRVKCATLPWHTLKQAMENKQEAVSTE